MALEEKAGLRLTCFWHCLQRTSVVKLRPTDYLYVIYHSNSPMTCNYNMWMRYNYNLPVRWCCDHTKIFTKMLLKVMFFLPLADTKSLWAQPLFCCFHPSHMGRCVFYNTAAHQHQFLMSRTLLLVLAISSYSITFHLHERQSLNALCWWSSIYTLNVQSGKSFHEKVVVSFSTTGEQHCNSHTNSRDVGSLWICLHILLVKVFGHTFSFTVFSRP